jgi:fatty-acid peroxygenase
VPGGVRLGRRAARLRPGVRPHLGLAAMVDGAGSVAPRNLRGQLLRHRTESWVGQLIERVRSGDLKVKDGRAVHVVARHRNAEGQLVDTDVARG